MKKTKPRVIIDGDSCSVIRMAERIAKKLDVEVHIFCDNRRILESDYSKIHIVDCGSDSADFAIINFLRPHDIIITNDSGLASMVLSRQAKCLHTSGREYTQENIMYFLTSRHIRSYEMKKSQKGRNNKKHNGKVHGLDPRTQRYFDDEKHVDFYHALSSMLYQLVPLYKRHKNTPNLKSKIFESNDVTA